MNQETDKSKFVYPKVCLTSPTKCAQIEIFFEHISYKSNVAFINIPSIDAQKIKALLDSDGYF
jgi:hypothetical protein